MTTIPDRMTYLIDCARQVLDGKELLSMWDEESTWHDYGDIPAELKLSAALSDIAHAMQNSALQVRIKPEPVVSELHFSFHSNGIVRAAYATRTAKDTHKLTIINDDGKVSVTIEEL